MEDQLFTWASLAGLGGAQLLTFLIVQYTKEPAQQWLRIPTDLYAVAVASIILILAQLALGINPADWRLYALSLANGFLVASAAGHMFNKAHNPPSPPGKKVHPNDPEADDITKHL